MRTGLQGNAQKHILTAVMTAKHINLLKFVKCALK